MNEDQFADLLMSEERKEWQNPEKIIEQIGIDENTNAADLGCGPGFFTIPLTLAIGRSAKIYAVDSSPTMLKHLVRNLRSSVADEIFKKVLVMEADVRKTTIPDSAVGLVLFAQILHDIEEHKGFFDEVKRIAAPECRFVNIDWHKTETAGMGPPLEIRLSENESRQILKQNGFRVVHALNAGPYHYGLVCKRS
jgi:ubiquinone/menaquinone biosynthesis C-methylase UbiE